MSVGASKSSIIYVLVQSVKKHTEVSKHSAILKSPMSAANSIKVLYSLAFFYAMHQGKEHKHTSGKKPVIEGAMVLSGVPRQKAH